MFNLIKGFSKYEISETGIIRNVKTKMIVSKENDGKNVRMINDAGERKSVKVSDLKAVTAKKESKKEVSSTKAASKKKAVVEQTKRKKEKISREQAEEIRLRYKKGDVKQKDLAIEYGVGPSAICEILSFKVKK
jgi:hypothetical protein